MRDEPVTATFHSNMLAEVILGFDKVVVSHSTNYKGMPALTFSPPPKDGVLPSPGGAMDLDQGAVVIAFRNMEAVLAHLDRIKALMMAMQAAAQEGRGSQPE